jgi:integrase
MGLQGYPGVTAFVDRHGKRRWRYRAKGRGGKQTNLPGNPGEPVFEAAYLAASTAATSATAIAARPPKAPLPKTFGYAAREVESTSRWKKYDPATQAKNIRLIEEFLEARVVEGGKTSWRDTLVAQAKRGKLKDFLSRYRETPAKQKHMLVAIRKLIAIAFDNEWIEVDPTFRLDEPIVHHGWKAWTLEAMRTFEARWPVGTPARTCYGLALWLGSRRGDVAALRWSDLVTRRVVIDGQVHEIEGFCFQQKKNQRRTGGKRLFVPVTPMLREIIEPLDRSTVTVVVTTYGKPFSEKSLTGAMRTGTS